MQSKTALHQMQEASTYSGSPAPPPAGPLGFANPNMGVEDMLTHIRRSKLTEGRPLKPVLPFPHQPHNDPTDSVCLIGEDSGRIKWIQPSGESLARKQDLTWGCMTAALFANVGYCQLPCCCIAIDYHVVVVHSIPNSTGRCTVLLVQDTVATRNAVLYSYQGDLLCFPHIDSDRICVLLCT